MYKYNFFSISRWNFVFDRIGKYQPLFSSLKHTTLNCIEASTNLPKVHKHCLKSGAVAFMPIKHDSFDEHLKWFSSHVHNCYGLRVFVALVQFPWALMCNNRSAHTNTHSLDHVVCLFICFYFAAIKMCDIRIVSILLLYIFVFCFGFNFFVSHIFKLRLSIIHIDIYFFSLQSFCFIRNSVCVWVPRLSATWAWARRGENVFFSFVVTENLCIVFVPRAFSLSLSLSPLLATFSGCSLCVRLLFFFFLLLRRKFSFQIRFQS